MSELKITPEVLEFAKTVFPEIAIPEKEEEITADYFTAKKGEVFITNELHQKAVSSAVGKFKGSAETVLRRVIGEGAKDKNADELLSLLETHMGEVNTRIEELKAGGKGISEAEKKELADLKKLAAEQTKLLEEKEAALQNAQTLAEQRIAKMQLDAKVNQLYKSAAWSDTANDYTRKGLWTDEVAEKYTFKEENGVIYVYDLEGGIVRDGASQMTAEKLFDKLLTDKSLKKVNGVVAGNNGNQFKMDEKDMTPQMRKAMDAAAKLAEQSKK